MSSIKRLRYIHRYLSIFFAPLLLFYCVSGAVILLRLDRGSKTISPPAAYYNLSKIHKKQRVSSTLLKGRAKPKTSKSFVWMSILMCVGVLVFTVIGVALAFVYSKNISVCLIYLVSGVVLPLLLLYLGGGIG